MRTYWRRFSRPSHRLWVGVEDYDWSGLTSCGITGKGAGAETRVLRNPRPNSLMDRITDEKPTNRYYSALSECLGDLSLVNSLTTRSLKRAHFLATEVGKATVFRRQRRLDASGQSPGYYRGGDAEADLTGSRPGSCISPRCEVLHWSAQSGSCSGGG